LVNNNLFLILVSGERDGKGFWLIDTTRNTYPLIENNELLECHRKELIGEESSISILNAINLNLENLSRDIREDGFELEKPPVGVSYSLPLSTLEEIYDFWFDLYKDKASWGTCLGLLNIKKRLPLKRLLNSIGIKGNAKHWAPIIEKLHDYRPVSCNFSKKNDPMWT